MYRIVDASNNNGAVNWPALKASGVKGAWLKVTEGTSFADSWYVTSSNAARKVGLRVGGYHFGHPKNDSLAEAVWFLAHLKLHPGDLLPVLDIETTDGLPALEVQRWAGRWLYRVEREIKQAPVIYSGDYFARANLGSLVKEYPMWVASYGARPVTRWQAWQWTDRDPFRLDESVAANPNALIYKPGLHRVAAKHLVRPVAPLRRRRIERAVLGRDLAV